MRLHTIPKIKGSTRPRKRLGAGQGNGHGKTCGRGQKGSKSRSGYSVRPGFEGGQMPLQRKLPRRGFNNARFRTNHVIVNLGDLDRFDGSSTVDRKALVAAGLVRDNSDPLKVLGNGDISKALKVEAHKFSASAKQKIEAAGGQAIVIDA